MNITISEKANPNYLAKIVSIQDFQKHPNADRLKLVNVDGFIVSVGIDTQPGIFIYFPVECQISDWYLKVNNLYRDKTLNSDQEATPGFFDEKGRVKALKLRNFISEGLVMPLDSLYKVFEKEFIDQYTDTFVNKEFDTVNDRLLVKKYVIKEYVKGMKSARKVKRYDDTIVEGQFRYHPDTEQLKKNMFELSLNDTIQISDKWHGTSAIFCNLLTKRKLSILEKIKKFFKFNVQTTEYKKFCSSRTVVKDPDLNKSLGQGYYDVDIWNIGLDVIKPHLYPGMSIYCELIGYTPTGRMIQKNYDYGCEYLPEKYDYSKMSPLEMYIDKLFNIYIYRITNTDSDGKVTEFSPSQIKDWSGHFGFSCVHELYYGTIENYISKFEEVDTHNWHEQFLKLLSSEYLEKKCKYCKHDVIAEGIVLRVDINNKFKAFKLKSLQFLGMESKALDNNEQGIEE